MNANDRTVPAADDPQARQRPARSRRHALRERWRAAWAPGGPLHALWDDVRTARDEDWHGMAMWLKTLLAVTGISTAVVLAYAAAGVVGQLLATAPKAQACADAFAGLWAVIDHPVRTYLASHSQGLPTGASTVYMLWLLTGLACLLLGGATRNNGVRLTWMAWGAATIAMVWTSSPEAGRTVAAAIAVLAWTLTLFSPGSFGVWPKLCGPTTRCSR